MRKATVVAAVAFFLIVPGLAASYTYSPGHYPSVRETLVEGHTVWAFIQTQLCFDNLNGRDDPSKPESQRTCSDPRVRKSETSEDTRYNVTVQRLGTAVAVLVRDRVKEWNPIPPSGCASNRDLVTTVLFENPGVLWFNDQFLVGDDLDLVEAEVDANADVCLEIGRVRTAHPPAWRYPCGGWVLSVRAEDPDPRGLLPWLDYVESYRIEDPNGYVWVIDRYGLFDERVDPWPSIDHKTDGNGDDDRGPGSNYDEDDHVDGDRRIVVGDYMDASPTFHIGAYPVWAVPVLGLDTVDPGPTSRANCPPYQDTAPRDLEPYGDGGDGTTRVYNAVLFFFFEDLLPTGVKDHGRNGRNDTDATGCEVATEWECGPRPSDDEEGNSHPYNPEDTGSGWRHLHPTARVDLYFSPVPPPAPEERDRRYEVFDTVGAAAPYHAHRNEPYMFDDRIHRDDCRDEDRYEWYWEERYDANGTKTGSSYSYTEREVSRNGDGEHGTDGVNSDDCTSDGYGGGRTGSQPEVYG